MSTQGVLFDFGGTREVGSAVSRDRLDEAFLEADRIITSSYDVRAYSLRELIRLQVSLQFENLRFEDQEIKETIATACFEAARKILERNKNVLRRLHERYKLGVVSNYNGNLEVVCREFELEQILDVILDSGNLPVSKPDPRIFHLALERLGLAPSECFYVGDSFERDIVPAKAVGLRTIWIAGKRGSQPPDPRPVDFVIATLPEIEHILLKERRNEWHTLKQA
jgi:putative hydrolase of the HAD superfamily